MFKRILILSFLLIPFLMSGQQSLKDYKKYAKALDKGKMKKAEKIAKKFSNDDSQVYLSLLKRVQHYNVTTEAELILDLVNDAINFKTEHDLALFNAEFVQEKNKIIESTIHKLDEILENQPEIERVYALRGLLHMDLLNYTQAVIDFTDAIEVEPDNAYLFGSRALAYRNINQLKLAIQDYSTAIDLDPTIAVNHLNLGFALLTNENYDLAIKKFQKAFEISNVNSTKAFSLNNIGYCHYKLGDLDEATETINESLRRFPINSYAYRNLALVNIAKNDLKEACKNLDKCLELGFTSKYGNEALALQNKHCK